MNAEQILESLSRYTGTETYYRTHPRLYLTDGAYFLANEAECFWLFDCINSYLNCIPTDEHFAVITFERKGAGGDFEIVNDVPATRFYATQHVEYTTFPLQRIKLYLSRATDTDFIVMLPSEY